MNETYKHLMNSHVEIFPTLLNQTSDLVTLVSIDEELVFRYVLLNDKAFDEFGWSEDIIGKRLDEVMPQVQAEQTIQQYKKAIDLKSSITFNDTVYIKDGPIEGEILISPIFDQFNNCTHILSMIRHLSDHQILDKAYHEKLDFYKAFIANSGDAISIWSIKGEVLELNQAFEKLFGWKKKDLLGEFIVKTNNFVPEHKKGEADYFRKQILLGETITDFQTQRSHKDGSLISVSITYSPIKDKEGNVIAVALSCRDITTSKKTQDQLRETKEQLELIWEHTADGIIMFTLEGKVLHINPAFTSLFGWTKKDIVGPKPSIQLIPSHLKDELQEIRTKLQKGEGIASLETQRRKKDGSHLDVMATYNPIVNSLGEAWAIVGIYKNISQKQKFKNQLIESEKRFKSLFENNLDGIYSLDLKGIFLSANKSVEQITAYRSEDLIGRSFIPIILPSVINQTVESFQKAVQGESVEYETSVIHRKGHKIDLLVKNIPIIIDDIVVGVYGIAKDITKDKQMLEELQKLKGKLESFIEDSSDAIHLVDIEGNVTFINDSFTEIYGFSKEDVIGKKLPMIPDGLKEEAEALYEKAWHGTKVRGIDLKRKRKDGTLVDISLTLSPVYNENEEVEAVSGVGRDITERIRKEKELQELKDEYELIWNSTTDAIFLIAQDGTIFKTNQAFQNILGWTGNDIQKHMFYTKQDENDKPNQDIILEQLRKGNHIINDETQRVTVDGIVLDLLASYRAINKGNLLAVGMYKDITKQKNVQTKLKESEERYRKLVEHSHEAIVVHSEGQIVYANEGALRLVNAKSKDEVVGKYMMAFVHPDDREFVLNRIRLVEQTGTTLELTEEKLLTVDGETINAEISSMLINFNEKRAFQVIIRDITARKKIEQTLRESEAKYRLIALNSHDLIKLLNIEGVITYASPSHKKLLGYEPEELIGKTFYDTVHLEDISYLQRKFKESLKSKSYCKVEFRQKVKDGKYTWVESFGTPILDENGMVQELTIASRDISKRKQYEEKLKNLAFRDSLTGLYNRRIFTELMENTLKEAKRHKRSFAVMYLDMDNFKSINDSYGHEVGDDLLIQFAERLKGVTKESDILARMGGDEFTILLSDDDNLNDVIEVAERIHKALQPAYKIRGHILNTTSSIGIAMYPDHGLKAKELVRNADIALYKAKESRNSFSIYK